MCQTDGCQTCGVGGLHCALAARGAGLLFRAGLLHSGRMGTATFDSGRAIDWGKTSQDYATHRPGPPLSFYRRLAALGVGLPRQRILDLGTGTGVLARQFSVQGARAAGVDIAAEQIAAALRLAREEGLDVDFRVAPAERTPFPDGSFDVVTANQCWVYFDAGLTVAEVRRLTAGSRALGITGGGLLVVSLFSWVPALSPIALQSEQLVLRFNPQWQGAGWKGEIAPLPRWIKDHGTLMAMFWYDEAIPFTRESWRGRMRACRGVAATLPPEQVQAYDMAHAEQLERNTPPEFTVPHRVAAYLVRIA